MFLATAVSLSSDIAIAVTEKSFLQHYFCIISVLDNVIGLRVRAYVSDLQSFVYVMNFKYES